MFLRSKSERFQKKLEKAVKTVGLKFTLTF